MSSNLREEKKKEQKKWGESLKTFKISHVHILQSGKINRIFHVDWLTKYQILVLSCLMENSAPHQDPMALNSGIFHSMFISSLKGSTVTTSNKKQII